METRTFKDEPGIQLMRALLLAHRRFMTRHRWIEGEGIGISEFDLVATLGNNDGMRMSEVARRMITSPQNVTRLARSLEQRKLVRRSRSPASGREVLLSLTPAGDELFVRLYPKAARFTIDIVAAVLSPDERQTLQGLLDKLIDGLEKRVL